MSVTTSNTVGPATTPSVPSADLEADTYEYLRTAFNRLALEQATARKAVVHKILLEKANYEAKNKEDLAAKKDLKDWQAKHAKAAANLEKRKKASTDWQAKHAKAAANLEKRKKASTEAEGNRHDHRQDIGAQSISTNPIAEVPRITPDIYHIIRYNTTGNCLASKGDALVSSSVADDDCMWLHVRDEDGSESLRNAVNGTVLVAERTQIEHTRLFLASRERHSCFHLFDTGGVALSANACSEGEPAVYTVVDGPRKLPSEHLHELQQSGITAVENILPWDSVSDLKYVLYRNPEGRSKSLTLTPIVARFVAHPVAAYLFREYIGDVHFGHFPTVSMRPGSMAWHTDHGAGLFEGRPRAVQFNICVDEFREDNAATQYVPGSHVSDEGIANVLRGDHGPEVNHMLPEHAEVRHMLAPAGAGIIYDARMWHRACGRECNRSGGDRIAILNSVTARSFRRMRFKESEANDFMESETLAMLTQREKDAVERLCLQND